MNKYRNFFLIVIMLLMSEGMLFAEKAASDMRAVRSVNSVISKLKNANYTCAFTFVYHNAIEESDDVQNGKCILGGKKLYVNMGGIETIFDGKTQWVYISSANEVTITEPTEQEMHDISPISMIEYYMGENRLAFGESDNPKYTLINFFPHNRNEEYFKIELKINTTTNLPHQLVIWQRNGDKLIFNWESIEQIHADDKMFIFQKDKYPNVEINDLR